MRREGTFNGLAVIFLRMGYSLTIYTRNTAIACRMEAKGEMMHNLPFLEKILASTAEYWVVAKENHYREYGESKRGSDDIILIGISSEVAVRPTKIDDLIIGDVRKIGNYPLKKNIYLTGNYGPFQYGLVLSSFYDGFPIEDGVPVKEFIIKALQLESNDWLEYKKLAESIKKEME